MKGICCFCFYKHHTRKNMFDLMEEMYVRMMLSINSFMEDEEGDTNFISILIMLAIVILLAGIFIGFKDAIIAQVQAIVDGFTIQ